MNLVKSIVQAIAIQGLKCQRVVTNAKEAAADKSAGMRADRGCDSFGRLGFFMMRSAGDGERKGSAKMPNMLQQRQRRCTKMVGI